LGRVVGTSDGDTMTEPGMIRVTRFSDIHGNPERLEYAWVGGPECRIDCRFAREASHEVKLDEQTKEIRIGPFRLKVIELDIPRCEYVCVRKDYPFWQFIFAWHRSNRLIDLVYRRSILTLAVWRLASYNPAVIPHWRDIHVLRKIAEWLKR